MNDKVFQQLVQVKSSGEVNMLDTVAVQRYAFDHDLFDLVLFIEEHKTEYVDFIFYGKR